MGREVDVRPPELIPAQVVQGAQVSKVKVVLCACGQVRVRLQRSRFVIRRERDGGGHRVVRGIPQREADVRVERGRTHSLAEYNLDCGADGNAGLTRGWGRRHKRGRDQIGSRPRGK